MSDRDVRATTVYADLFRQAGWADPDQATAMREALSWALDALELSLERLDTIDTYSPEHYEIRAAGLAKARSALAAVSNGETGT